MKRIITRLILATLLISGGEIFAQKDGFSLHLSGVFPNGKFAEFDDNDKVCALVDGNSKTGSAGMGFGAGFKYQFPIPQVANLRFLVGAELMYNPLNGDAKDWFDDEFTSRTESGDGYSYDYDYEVTLPKYLNVPLMAGLNYAFKLNDKINIFGEFAAGINMRLITNFKVIYECKGSYYDYEYDYSNNTTSTSEDISKYDNAITFAYRFGAGITFDRISIGLHWYNLGSAKVKGKIEMEENYSDSDGETEHDSDKEKFKWKDLSISMMTLTVGYHF